MSEPKKWVYESGVVRRELATVMLVIGILLIAVILSTDRSSMRVDDRTLLPPDECPPCYSDGMELPGPPPTVLITGTQVPCRSCYDQE